MVGREEEIVLTSFLSLMKIADGRTGELLA